jgi:hypothetical protein
MLGVGKLKEQYTIGFGKAAMTFSDTLPMGNYTRAATPLQVRCITIVGPTKMLLLSLEMTSLPNQAVAKLRKIAAQEADIGFQNIWITVTHSFSSPHLPQESSVDTHRYTVLWDKMVTAVTEAIRQAMTNQQAFTMGRSKISCPLNVYRNVQTPDGWWLGANFAGYSNHDLRVLTFKQASGHLGLIYNYDIQSSVFDHLTDDDGQLWIDDDLVGHGSANFEDRHPGSVAIFIPGAAGDQRPLLMGDNTKSFAENQYLCRKQADVLDTCIEQAQQMINKWVPLQLLARYRQECRVAQKAEVVNTFEIKPTRKFVFEATGQRLSVGIDAWQFNQWLLVGTQPELNSEFGDACRYLLPDKSAMIGTMVNGALKYLPDSRDFQRITYQAMNSFIGQGADKDFQAAIQQLCRRNE